MSYCVSRGRSGDPTRLHLGVDADIQSFFDTVDHDLLLDAVNEEVADGSVLRLIRKILQFVIFAKSAGEAQAALELARKILEGPLRLVLHPKKTRVVSVADGSVPRACRDSGNRNPAI